MKQQTAVGDRIGPISLRSVDNREVELISLLDRPVVIPLVRYYGCMPCKAFLYQLEDRRADFDSIGVTLVGVGGAADYQARHLMDNGIGYQLLLDPEHELYRALDVHHIEWTKMLAPRTWRNYASAARRARQGRITDHPLQAPGLAIIDVDRTVRVLHRGKTLGDYPPVAQILEDARRLTP